MTSTIRIEAGGRTWTADAPRTFLVGRDSSCDVSTDVLEVSRRHAEIRPAGTGWELVDLGSSGGTYVDGRRLTPQAPVALTGTTTVQLGQPGAGLALTVVVTPSSPAFETMVAGSGPGAYGAPSVPAAPTSYGGPPAPPAPAAPAAPAPPAAPAAYDFGAEHTQLPPTGGPGGVGGGPGLVVRLRSGDRQFPALAPVRIGREQGNEVVADNPSVSRLHAVVEPRHDGWWLVDRSTAGTFVDGERVSNRRITEPTEVHLGHPTAGYELELVPVVDARVASAGIARRKRRRTLAVVGAALGVLVLVGGGVAAAVVLGDDEDPPPAAAPQQPAEEGGAGLSQEALDRAKAATVFLVAYDAAGEVASAGSGSIISEDGLVLSNAHVADPASQGEGGAEVDHVEVYFTTPGDDDAPVELRYRATPIVSDGYLDITVAQIDADAEGNPVEAADLDLPEPLPLGDSDELRTADEITALGYPDLSRANSDATGLPTLTVTKGTVAAFNNSEVIGVDRAEIDADLRIGSGNSGGPSINSAGEVIGLNTRVFTENLEQQLEDQGGGEGGIFTGGSARIVPVNLAADVLAIAEDGGDPDYVSPYFEMVPDPEEQMTGATIEAHGWALDGNQGSCSGTSTIDQPQILSVAPGDLVHAEFVVEGLADGTPFSFDLFTFGPGIEPGEIDTAPVVWDEANNGICVFVTFQVPENVPGINAVPLVGEQYVVDNPLAFQ